MVGSKILISHKKTGNMKIRETGKDQNYDSDNKYQALVTLLLSILETKQLAITKLLAKKINIQEEDGSKKAKKKSFS